MLPRCLLLGGGLDNSHGHSLPHVMDSETSQGREVREGRHAHGLGGLQAHNTGVKEHDELGSGLVVLSRNI